MAIRWQIKFTSFLGTSYVLSIYDANYTGSSITGLRGAAEPFVTSEDTDEVFYIPIRTQSGYIKFIAENDSIVGELMPVLATDRPVVLRTAVGEVCWVGFLSQEQYSQPWGVCPYEVEIPVVSVMMAMQGVQFTQGDGYTSVLGLLNIINDYLPVDISAVTSDLSPIDEVFVQNRNFHEAETGGSSLSTSNECDTIYDCLEQFCLYFGVSLREYGGVFFFAVAGRKIVQYYEDITLDGSKCQSLFGIDILDDLCICGADNKRDYSAPYRRVIGSFETGKGSFDDLFGQPTFLERFAVQGAYPTGAESNLLFYGDDEVLPYRNDVQQSAWVDILYDYGGQIIRHRPTKVLGLEQSGISWNDYFYVVSQEKCVGTPSRAIAFNMRQKIYINEGDYTALNINCNVSPWFDLTHGSDFVKRLYCKIRVGDYWLHIIKPPNSYNLLRYEWTTEESVCYLNLDNGKVIHGEGFAPTIHYIMETMMDTFSGLAIDMPAGLSAGYYSVYFELLCNAETMEEFGDSPYIGYLISGLEISVLRAPNSPLQPTPNLESNDFTVTAADTRGGDYTVGCAITTKQGVQYGAGCVLDSSKSYITTRYDKQGIDRRAQFLARSRDLLTIDVRKHIQPIETVRYDGKNYAVLSQSINWRDDTNNIKIIET